MECREKREFKHFPHHHQHTSSTFEHSQFPLVEVMVVEASWFSHSKRYLSKRGKNTSRQTKVFRKGMEYEVDACRYISVPVLNETLGAFFFPLDGLTKTILLPFSLSHFPKAFPSNRVLIFSHCFYPFTGI